MFPHLSNGLEVQYIYETYVCLLHLYLFVMYAFMWMHLYMLVLCGGCLHMDIKMHVSTGIFSSGWVGFDKYLVEETNPKSW